MVLLDLRIHLDVQSSLISLLVCLPCLDFAGGNRRRTGFILAASCVAF